MTDIAHSDPTVSKQVAQPSAARDRPQPGWRRLVGHLGGAFLGGVLLVAAFTKAIHPIAFTEQIQAEGLDFLLPAGVVTMIALALEAGLGSALLLGVRRLWTLLPTAGLVVFFLFLTGRTYWRDLNGIVADEGHGCGCFGNLVERTPAEAFWQDLFLMVPALLLAFIGWRLTQRRPWLRMAAVTLFTMGTLVLAFKAPELPLDDLATRMKPGVELESICGGTGDSRLCLPTVAPELSEGEHLVVIADLADESFGERVGSLNQYLQLGESVMVLADVTPEDQNTFFWSYGPAFEIRETPAALLAPLYRELPRSFKVKDGVVTRTWAGLPPLPEPAADPF